MPYTQGTYSSIEKRIYDYIVHTLRYNTAVACGILGNVEEECEFNPTLLVDDGGADAYGICQWRSGRLTTLRSRSGGSYKPSLEQQLDFLKYELGGGDYRGPEFVKNIVNNKYPNTAQGAYDAGYDFARLIERPANNPSYPGSLWTTRANNARNKYWAYYSGNPNEGLPLLNNLGAKIVEEARKVINHKPKIPYKWGERSLEKGFDCSGFVWYCYNQAGVEYTYRTSAACYEYYKDTAKSIDPGETAAGDLLFYKDSSRRDITHIAIANGEGGRVHAASSSTGIVESDSLGNPSYILRILSDAETRGNNDSNLTFDGLLPEEYISLTINDPYSLNMTTNLSKVEAAGYDYGYLIDLTHGGEFKFYIPEFSEQAGANWGTVDIRGRSVQVLSYDNTNSRSVSISLDLYAGEGLYKPTQGETGVEVIDRLHKDAFFLKSLEYPDYSTAIAAPPSTVHLILGSAISFIGVVSDVSVEHLKPQDAQNRSMYIKASFKVTQIAGNPPDYRDIRNGQYSLISTANTNSLYTGNSVDDTNAPVYSDREG